MLCKHHKESRTKEWQQRTNRMKFPETSWTFLKENQTQVWTLGGWGLKTLFVSKHVSSSGQKRFKINTRNWACSLKKRPVFIYIFMETREKEKFSFTSTPGDQTPTTRVHSVPGQTTNMPQHATGERSVNLWRYFLHLTQLTAAHKNHFLNSK